MAYRKSSYKARPRRRPTTRRPRRAAAPSYASTALRALTLATRVASIVNAEKNHYDISGSVAPTTTGAFFPLVLPSEGDDIENRSGRSIKLAGLMLRSSWSAATANTTSIRLRLFVVVDKQALGVVPSITDILETSDVNAFRQIDTVNPQRYKIIMDKMITFPTAAGGAQAKTINKYFPFKHHVRYILSTAVQAASGSGQVYFGYFSDTGTGLSVNWSSRVRYYDN